FEQYASSLSISADGSRIVIGAPGAATSGMAFLYNRGGQLLRAYQAPASAGSSSGFGSSVSIQIRNDTSMQTENDPDNSGSQTIVIIGAIFAPATDVQGTTVG